MKVKEFIKYTKRLDGKGLAICDGVSENFDSFSILYPLFIITGLSIFMWFLMKWKLFREKN